MKLYKYTSYKNLEYILKGNTLKFDSITNYNDPFEGVMSIICPQDEIEKEDHTNKAISIKETQKKNFLMTCFSTTNQEILMWSHYAENHTGVCLEFEVNENLIEFEETHHSLIKGIKYSNRVPEYILTKNLSAEIFEYIIIDSLTTKSSHWAYEKEVRFIINTKEQHEDCKFIKFNPSCLKSVSIGCHMPDSDRTNTLRLVDAFNQSSDCSVTTKDLSTDFFVYALKEGIGMCPKSTYAIVNGSLFSNSQDLRRKKLDRTNGST